MINVPHDPSELLESSIHHSKSSILVVEDDQRVLRLEQLVLEYHGYEVIAVGNAKEAIDMIAGISPSLVVLDIGLPGIDGFNACRCIREFSPLPIIMVTANDSTEHKIKGLDSGADDYITKPFSPSELAARVGAALRRSTMGNEVVESAVQVGELQVNFAGNRVMLSGQEVVLSDTEYRLLCYLARNAGRIVTRDQILERIWGEEYLGANHLLDTTIGRLRQKLEDRAREPRYILTRRGVGYSFPPGEEGGAYSV